MIYYQSYIAEVLSAIGGENYSLITNLVGRILLTCSISLICIYVFKLEFKSILIGVIMGQLLTLLANIGYYIYLLLYDRKALKANLKEVELFTSIDKKTD